MGMARASGSSQRGSTVTGKLSPETVAFYEAMMKKMSDSGGWKEKYLKQYMLSPAWMGTRDFMQMVNQSETLFKDVLKDLGLLK